MTSPLRYPGGKTRATKLLWTFLDPTKKVLVSPFFGGGSFELYCASRGMTVYGNDAFSLLSNFWTVLSESPTQLADAASLLRPISKAEFYRMKTYINTEEDPILRAAYYFAINRSSFSGSTVCGGFSEQAAAGRFNLNSIARLEKTALSNIKSVECSDFTVFLEKHPPSDEKIVFLDPPYYIKKCLYGAGAEFDHVGLSVILNNRSDWMLCYNDCEYIRELYNEHQIQKVKWTYGMNVSKESSEIVILPRKL